MKRSLVSRLKGKKFRDFIVYGKRKQYLRNTKKKHEKFGEEYFFSDKYLRRHTKVKNAAELVDAFVHSDSGLFESDKSNIAKRLQRFYQTREKELLEFDTELEGILKHEFDLLGSGVKNLNKVSNSERRYSQVEYIDSDESSGYNEINWHYDFKSGYQWRPEAYYPESREYVKSPGADIKVPWELSRMQHLLMLGVAYLVRQDSRFSVEIVNQILDWINNNTLCKGPNWNCPMDVGIRVANWVVALELIRDDLDNYRKELEVIVCSVIQHIDYLWNNFEWSSRLTSNHYLSDLSGLLFAVIYLPKLKERKRYLNFLTTEFDKEINMQMYRDGMNSEGSLPYHRLVFELFAYSHMLAKNNGVHFSSDFEGQLKRSTEFTKVVTDSRGQIPQIGDNDAGIFLKFVPRSLTDFGYLSVIGMISSDTSKNCSVTNVESAEEVLFNYQCIEDADASLPTHLFKESGIAIVNSRDSKLCFYNGSNGQKGNGGHCHNDRLSFTLTHKEQPILVDPGTGVYTSNPEIRNRYRSTAMHSTVMVNGEEQNRFFTNGYLFGCHEDIQNQSLELQKEASRVRIIGSHDGYVRGDLNVRHTRSISCDEQLQEILIEDRLSRVVSATANFIIKRHDGLITTRSGIISPYFELRFEKGVEFISEQINYSPSYGVFVKNGCLRISVNFCDKLITNILLK